MGWNNIGSMTTPPQENMTNTVSIEQLDTFRDYNMVTELVKFDIYWVFCLGYKVISNSTWINSKYIAVVFISS